MPREQSQSTSGKPYSSAEPRHLNLRADPELNAGHGASNNSSGHYLSHEIDPNYSYMCLYNRSSTSTHAGVDTARGETFGSTRTGLRDTVLNSSDDHPTALSDYPSAPLRKSNDDDTAKCQSNFNPCSSRGSSDAHSSPGVSLYQIASTSVMTNSSSISSGPYPRDIFLGGSYPDLAPMDSASSRSQRLPYAQSDNPSARVHGATTTYSSQVQGVANNYGDAAGTDTRSSQLLGQYNNYTRNPSDPIGSKSPPSRWHSSTEADQGSADGNPASQTPQEDEETRRDQERTPSKENLYRENKIASFINGDGPWVFF
ncbi:hypothetical protein F4811DRAFT_550406 [Daldinia bambusicola]|nr:hypothetical protein F4811DRAFT_550406 [Daldinia bambusicola]